MADAWSAEHAYASIDEVAASDVDAVHICTPNSSHVPFAVQLMEAGKHVLCEKPLATSVEEAESLRGLVYCVRADKPPPTAGKRIELTLRALVLGCLLAVVFTAANTYLGLLVGLTGLAVGGVGVSAAVRASR